MARTLTRKPHQIGHITIALIKVIRGIVALIVSGVLWHIVITGELQDVKDQLQDLSQRLNEPVFNAVMNYINQTSEQQLIFLALLVSTLSIIRFTEAAGLWSVKRWAEILALLGSLIYIPLEVMALLNEASLVVSVILIANLLITAYLFKALRDRAARQH